MLTESFIFLDGISDKTEQQIWSEGIKDWNDFLNAPSIKTISPQRKITYNLHLQKAHNNLKVDNIAYFSSIFPSTEHWRLFNRYKDEAAYLDIETSSYQGDITVVGIYDSTQVMTFVKGKNLDRNVLQETLNRYKLLITFNGSSFDLPMIKKYFNPKMDQAHIDLRHVCARLGMTGGLKQIEKSIGITRPEIVKEMDGGDAALLWRMYKATGNEKYLQVLVQYNEEDIVNLERLAKQTIPELWKKVRYREKQEFTGDQVENSPSNVQL